MEVGRVEKRGEKPEGGVLLPPLPSIFFFFFSLDAGFVYLVPYFLWVEVAERGLAPSRGILKTSWWGVDYGLRGNDLSLYISVVGQMDLWCAVGDQEIRNGGHQNFFFKKK